MTRSFIFFRSSVFLFFLLAAISNGFAQTNTSTGAGTTWNTPGNWSLGHVPLPAEDVVVNTNITMNMPAGAFTVNSITVNAGKILTIGNSTTAQTINVTTFVNVAGTLNVGAFTATHALTIGGTLTNTGTINLWNSTTQVCNVTLNGTSITGNGTTYTFNHLTIGSAVINNSTSTINIKGNLTLNDVFTSVSGTINFNGGLAQSITGTTNPVFSNLSFATNGTNVSLSGISGITVAGTFTMTNTTTFDFGPGSARIVTIGGNLVTPQTIIMAGTGLAHRLILSGTANAAPATFTTTAGSGSTVEYNNATSQTVFASANYRNMELSGGGTKTFSGSTTINNDLKITGSGIVVSIASTLTVGGDLNNAGTGTTVWGGTATTLNLTGNLIVTNNTTFSIGNAAQVKTLNVTGNVQVDAGSSINVGAFAAAHIMSIAGNLQVDGSFNMVQTFPGNVCNVTFTGATSNTVTSPAATGTIRFNQITLTKSAIANVLDVQTPITMSSPTAAGTFLTLTSGTFKLSSASTITPYFGTTTICSGAASLWLNDPNANVACVQAGTGTSPGVPTVAGTLHITNGTFAYGSGDDIMLLNAATSNLWIDGGNLNIYGGIAFSSTSQFNMTSGNVRIDPQAANSMTGTVTMLSFASANTTNAVSFTGGTLTLVDPPNSTTATALFITPTAGYAYNFSGSTINFGDGASNNSGTSTAGFTIDGGSRYALSNVVLNNGTSTGASRFVRLLNTDLIINNSLVIGNNASDNFSLNGRLLTLNGTLTVGTGTITGSATSSLAIGGNNTPVMNLPPIVGGNLLNLTINKTGTDNTVNLGGPIILAATGLLTLTSGILEIGNYNLTLTNSGATAITGSSFSATKMIATDGTGYLIKNAASTQALNPIGAGGYYSPMTMTSITTGGTYSIRVVPTALNPAYINAYWDLVASTTGKTITATFQYDPAQLNGASQIISYSPAPYTTVQRPPSSGTSSFGTNSFTITGSTMATSGGYWSMGNTSTYYSYQTGNWNVPSTWTSDPSGSLQIGSTVPGYNDNVVILPGRTVTLTTDVTAQCGILTIENSGFVDMTTYSFTNGLAALDGEGTLRLASVNFPAIASSTFINAGGGTVEYYNASSFTLPVTQTTYNNLTINSPGQVATQLMNLTLNGNLLVKNGTFQINDNTSARRQLTINGNVTVNNGASIAVGKGVTNTVTTPTTITTTVAGPFIDYYDNHSHRVVIYGDFVNNGTVNFSNLSFPVYNAFPSTTLGTTTGFATVYFRGSTSNVLTCNNTTNFYNLVLDKGSDQTYSLTVNASAYSNFKLFGANTAAADALMGASATNPNMKKALWIRNGTLILQGSTSIPSLTEGNTTGTLPATSDYFIPANGALYINGPDVVVLGTSDDYREVNVMYGISGGSGLVNGVALGGYSSLYVYGKLQMSDGYLSTRESGGIITNGGSGQIVINGGDVDAKQFLNGTGSTASFQMTGGLFALRGRFKRTPASYTTIDNLVDNSSTTINTARALNGTTTGFGTFNINNTTNIFNMSGGDIWIYDVCDAAPSATAPYAFDVKSSASNISVTGGTLTIIPTTGTVLADETSYLISSTASLGNLVINRANGSAVVKLNTSYPLTVLSNVSIQAGSFDANAQNLTIGGDFTIASGTSYVAMGASANTTVLNGSGTQAITVNTAGSLDMNNLTLTKATGVAVNFAGSQKTINLAGNLNLTLGTLNDNGNSIFVKGNVYNSGVHAGTGKISLNGSASTQSIDGNGIFQNLELNSTNAATAPISLANNATINGTLTLSQNNLFNISTYNLKFNASASVINASSTRYIQSAGNAGDGGITKVYSSPAAFVFPLGAASTSHVGVPNYTPASIGLSAAPTVYGSITVVPVGYAHPNETTAGRSLSYFWRVKSSGFTLGTAKVTHGYTYSVNDVITGTGITENGYVAARYDVNTTTWTKGTTSDLDITNKVIGQPTSGTFLKDVSFIDGDYTAGDDNPTDPFGTPKVFYSYTSGLWGASTSWTSDPTRATYVNIGVPGATDVVHIGAGHTISFATPTNYLTNPNTDPHSCATLYIDANSVLDVRYNPSSNLGIVMNSSLGNGKIRITASYNDQSTFANPAGDFSSFNTNLGTTELYSTNPIDGTTYWMANGVNTYGNLLFSPLGGSNIIFPNNDVLIYGNCTETGANADSWLLPTWNVNYPTAPVTPIAKTITINGNLDIQGGAFGWYGNGSLAENVVVKGNVSICTSCAMGVFGGATNQTLTIGGSLINNGSASTTGVTGGDFSSLPLIFNGSTSASITNTAGTPITRLGTVTVNKGSSQATTLNLTIGGTLTTNTDNWLTLQNGTLQYQRTNPATDFTISTATNLNIPATAGLYINYTNGSNTNVLISNSSADASDLLLSGKLTVVSGNVYVGPTSAPAYNNDIEYSGNTAAIQVSGGNLYVNGQIRRSTASTNGALSYTQSNGAVTINGNTSAGGQATALTRAKLEVLNSGSQFNMSGGTLTLQRGGGTTFGDLYIRPSTSTVTGGTITFTNAVPNTVQNYSMDATASLYNLTVTAGGAANTNATVSLVTNPLVLKGTLTLSNSKSIFNANNKNVTINQNLVNNGTAASYVYGTNLTTFSGAAQNISGTSVTNFYDLTVASSLSLTVNNSFTVNRNLTISSGSLSLNSYKVSVLTNGNFINNGAYSDDNVTGGVSMAGSSQQDVSGTGSFNRLEINNTADVRLLNDITLDHNLVMTNGVFNIQSNNLTLNTTSDITGASFSSSKMIMTDGVATSLGLTKFFPVISSTTTFTYPVGVASKYTPAVYTINANGSIGYINVSPVNSYQPTVLDPTRVLDYYFSISSSGITGFNGSLVLNYLASDVRGTEASYVAGWLQLPGTFWSKAAVGSSTDNVNETTHQISFPFPAGSSNLNGDYTAGEDDAIPSEIPTYISNSDGNWSDNTIWTPVGSSPPCPVGGPNGYNVIIKNIVSTTVNNCFAYSTVIQGTGKLAVLSPTYGHNFGTVDGDATLGTGTVYLEGANLPAGNFTPFMDCLGSGTLEYGGTGTYTLILNGFTTIPNLTVSGTGTRVLPNTDLTICHTLKIDGPILDNSVSNRQLTINGSMERYNTGAFVSGSGSNATVSFSGTAAQTLGGTTGDFTGANAFNNLEINNSSGLSIGTNGNIEVNGNLLLTNGIITTSTTNNLSILNTSSTAVVPTGGSSASYISGPLEKQIVNGDNFVYPLGKGSVKGHTFTLTSASTGSSLFTAEYFTPNPTSGSVTAPIVKMNRLEYWAVSATTTKSALVDIAWDAQSDLNGSMTVNGISDLEVTEYNTGTSSWVGLASTTSGVNNLGDARTTSSVSLSVTPKNYSLGSISNAIPIATLSPSGAICGTAGIPVTFTSHFVISLNYTISYTFNGVAQTPIVVTSLPFKLPTPAAGTYQLTGFTYNNSTVAGVVDDSSVTTDASPTTANAGSNQSICNATSLNLSGNSPAVGTGLWTIVSGTGGWFNTPNATNYNALFGGPPGHTYTLKWTITNGSCTSSSNVVISFPYVPQQPSPFTAAPTSVCKGSTGNIYTVPAVSGATSYIWSYSGTGATITGSGNSVSVSFSSTATNGTMSVAAVNGCGPGTARTVSVSTVTPAVATFSYTGTPYCPNATNPSPAFSGGGVAGTFSSTTGLVFVSTATGQVNLAASTPGTYTVTNTIAPASPCGAIIATSTITITPFGNWIGGVSSDWLDPNNWNCTTVPTSSTDVVIPSSATYMPVISAAGAVCRNLTVNSGASLTINTTNTLNVYGSWSNSGTFNRNSSTVIFNGTGTIGGSTVTSFNSVTIAATGNVTAPGTNVNVSGDWTNNGSFTPSTGTITFNGSTANNINGSTAFYNLSISKTNNVTLSGTATTTVHNILTLTNGKIISSSTHPVALSATGSVSGGSANSYISGPMTKVLTGTSFTFPLGSISANRYRPASINNVSGSDTWTAEYFGADPTTGGYSYKSFNSTNVQKVSMFEYWVISRLGSTSADLTLSYDVGSYIPPNIGTVASLEVVRWNGSYWDVPPGGGSFSQTGTNITGTSTVTNVTSFSPFTHGSQNNTSPLPIHLLYFKAAVAGDAVLTQWATTEEVNNDYFTVEKSSDGETFVEAGRIPSQGNDNLGHQYSFSDPEPYQGLSYYRLKQTDFDKNYTYSKVVAVNYDGTGSVSMRAYPNPFAGKKITLEIKGFDDATDIPVQVFDLVGQLIMEKVITTNKSGSVKEDLIFDTSLATGLYVIKAGRLTQKVEVE
ncbi:MAG TPA: hypothetical protein VIM75_02930 [Ohtaekwangia sp.]|uniref:hypothetical protein n=1 Tax=Ohtaekwangia sp. TaxID=2066019 RepID=UPI002F945732